MPTASSRLTSSSLRALTVVFALRSASLCPLTWTFEKRDAEHDDILAAKYPSISSRPASASPTVSKFHFGIRTLSQRLSRSPNTHSRATVDE